MRLNPSISLIASRTLYITKPCMKNDFAQLPSGISILIPVYNSAELMPTVTGGIMDSLKKQSDPWEIILVDDGSQDQSWSVIQSISDREPRVIGLRLMRNFGQHNALLCALRAATYNRCVTMDDDGQHPPEHIHTLLATLEKGYDVVYGTPRKEQHGLFRDAASRITKIALQNAMGAQTAGNVSALRAFRTQLREAFYTFRSPFVSLDVLLTWATTRFTALPLEHQPRLAGNSNYTFRKLFTHALNMMTGFTVLPLQFAIWTGFAFTCFGLLILAFVIGRTLVQGNVVPGFAFLASIIAIFSGAQLFALGIFGEYLARMHFRIMERPPYAVREMTSSPENIHHE